MRIAVRNGMLLREAGEERAPVVVCLHAFADHGAAFVPLFETALATRYRLLAVDLPGFGASPRQDGVGTIEAHGRVLAQLVEALAPGRPIGLVAHSVASCIAVNLAQRLADRLTGLFSIEGNLTADDAYFTGRAANYDDPVQFKTAFLDEIWAMARDNSIMRRYWAAAFMSDSRAMWELGRDAKRISVGDMPGREYQAVRAPTFYYWSPENTSATTRAWIAATNIANRQFTGAGHWPMVERPEQTAEEIANFFAQAG